MKKLNSFDVYDIIREVAGQHVSSREHSLIGDEKCEGKNGNVLHGQTFSIKGSFSEEYSKIFKFSKTGAKQQESGQINVDVLTVYESGAYLSVRVIQQEYTSEINRILNLIFQKLLSYYDVVSFHQTNIGSTNLIEVTINLSRKKDDSKAKI